MIDYESKKVAESEKLIALVDDMYSEFKNVLEDVLTQDIYNCYSEILEDATTEYSMNTTYIHDIENISKNTYFYTRAIKYALQDVLESVIMLKYSESHDKKERA
jgi:hypothetical protein